ncbi:type II secretion system GspH family protein [bacterium]|nr:type II secretion system GspH family protein [bacterium]
MPKKALPVQSGFTMIELLLVISIIGVLSGVLLSVVNVQGQRDMANDAVRRASIEQIIESLETHYAVEGYYPADKDASSLSIYMSIWPDDHPTGSIYDYATTDGATFGIVVATARTGVNLKYLSDWGEIRECANGEPDSEDCN